MVTVRRKGSAHCKFREGVIKFESWPESLVVREIDCDKVAAGILFGDGLLEDAQLKCIPLFQGLCVAVLFCFCNGEVSSYDYGNSRFCPSQRFATFRAMI